MPLTEAEQDRLRLLELEAEQRRRAAAKTAPVTAPKPPAAESPTLGQRAMGALGTGLQILSKPADAMNAFQAELARQTRQHQEKMEKIGASGRMPTFDEGVMALPRTLGDSLAAGWKALTDVEHSTPPTAFRERYGLEKGKAGRGAYNAASVLDYLYGAATDPTNLIGGPVAKGVEKVVGPVLKPVATAAVKVGTNAAKTRPVAAAIRVAQWPERKAAAILANHTENLWTKAVGLQKQAWLSQPATQAANAMSNVAVSELALRRNGVGVAGYPKALKEAAAEMTAMWRGKGTSADIAELAAQSPSLAGTFTTQVGKAAGATKNPFLAVHGGMEQVAKVALFKALKPKLGAAEAAREVERHLFDYSSRPALLELADVYGAWVFNAFPTKAAGLFVDTLIHRPDLVARYPRLQRMLEEEFPGSKEALANAAPWQKGMFTYPTGKDTFVSLDRYSPLAQPMETARGIRDLLAGKGAVEAPAPDALFGSTVLGGPELQAMRKVPKDAPVEHQLRAFIREELMGRVPLLRTLGVPGLSPGRIGSARQGVAMSDSMFAEPQTVKQAVMQALAGITTFKAETREAKQERLSPAMAARADAAGALVDQIDRDLAGGRIKNPYTTRAAKITERAELEKRAKHADAYLSKLATSPRYITPQGKLTPTGRDTLKNVYLDLMALSNRLDEMDRQETTQRRH